LTQLLEQIETYFKDLLDRYSLHNFAYVDEVADKFNLKILNVTGTTRAIFKKKGSRTVIKVGYPWHNKAEYAAYKALEPSVLGDLLAPCLDISKEGYCLEMTYIAKPIPYSRGQYYWYCDNFERLRGALESHFKFIEGYNNYNWAADFHEENLRIDRQGNIKIVDYSSLLSDVFARRPSTTTISSAIRGVGRLAFPEQDVKFYAKNKSLHYRDSNIYLEVDFARSTARL